MENNNIDDEGDDNRPVFPLPRRRPHPPVLPPGRQHSLASAVVSGDSDDGNEDIFDDVDDIFVEDTNNTNLEHSNNGEYNDDGDDGPLYAQKPFDSNCNNDDDDDDDGLYDKDLDEENEAYVYKYLRSGIKEEVQVVTKQQDNNNSDPNNKSDTTTTRTQTTTKNNILAYKPRNTDAVLSCPCCFNIVCMDCQRHTKYTNQYRAMFVMGIIVDWYTLLVYDESKQQLRKKENSEESLFFDRNNVVAAENSNHHKNNNTTKGMIPHYEEGEYFPVLCADCRTEVAALDMTEEMYHFHGCLESLG